MERAVKVRPSARMIFERAIAAIPLTVYLGPILLLTAILTGVVLWKASHLGVDAGVAGVPELAPQKK